MIKIWHHVNAAGMLLRRKITNLKLLTLIITRSDQSVRWWLYTRWSQPINELTPVLTLTSKEIFRRYKSYGMGPNVWTMPYGPYHKVHMICSIKYTAYTGIIWFTCKIVRFTFTQVVYNYAQSKHNINCIKDLTSKIRHTREIKLLSQVSRTELSSIFLWHSFHTRATLKWPCNIGHISRYFDN